MGRPEVEESGVREHPPGVRPRNGSHPPPEVPSPVFDFEIIDDEEAPLRRKARSPFRLRASSTMPSSVHQPTPMMAARISNSARDRRACTRPFRCLFRRMMSPVCASRLTSFMIRIRFRLGQGAPAHPRWPPASPITGARRRVSLRADEREPSVISVCCGRSRPTHRRTGAEPAAAAIRQKSARTRRTNSLAIRRLAARLDDPRHANC